MKKTYLTVALVCTICGALTLPSCIGSFTLSNKLLSWNKQIGNKFVNELVFFAFWVLPVYEVSGLADIIVLNSIEFWSGSNPIAKGTKTIQGNDGKYLVKCDGKGYTIKSENDGSVVRLDFDADNQSWSYSVPGGEKHTIFTFVDDTHISLPTPDGTETVVEISEAGLYAYQAIVTGSQFAMN
ncbi:MAG: DUF3332 domain-containing protein [Muribaculaceae bacterium]|nr:DUF3332 domain-containing protein [Muribaculaceae bacterium]MDE5595952.1 DUF3332 domain-containing protein [Muribaculaceae bacterium]